jgi:hypothetical protein
MAKSLKDMVLTASGKDTATLADFDLTPRKIPVVSPETRVAAAKKGAATRKALGTMGSQQKAPTSFDEQLCGADFAGFVELRAVA